MFLLYSQVPIFIIFIERRVAINDKFTTLNGKQQNAPDIFKKENSLASSKYLTAVMLKNIFHAGVDIECNFSK